MEDSLMQPNKPKYKKYRVYLSTASGGAVMAASNTVNDLVDLVKYWLTRTSTGMYLPPDVRGTVQLHELDEVTGAYRRGAGFSFKNKKDIVTQVRKLGGR